MIKRVRGLYDILPNESIIWQQIEKIAREIFICFGYFEIRLPIFEYTDLFSKSIGEQTDIVTKEMYTFPDRKKNLLTLRPEGTASVVRAFIEHKIYQDTWGSKLYYMGPMFRYERPQAGRSRQFHQIGAESFGLGAPQIDAEMVILLNTFLERLFGKSGNAYYSFEINSLGCKQCRPKYQEALLKFLSKISDNLCPDCISRYEKNPLRVLDCKNNTCKEQLKDVPRIGSYLCSDCDEHFKSVLEFLHEAGVIYHVNSYLVRGLDYYTRTTFEVLCGNIGAQNAIAGGGRYDYLVETFGGPPTPACGFAIGFERLVMALSDFNLKQDIPKLIYIVYLGDSAKKEAFALCNRLRIASTRNKVKFCIEMDYENRSFKSQMRLANKRGAAFCLILGDKEIEQGEIIIKDMSCGEQENIKMNEVEDKIFTNRDK